MVILPSFSNDAWLKYGPVKTADHNVRTSRLSACGALWFTLGLFTQRAENPS